MLEETRSLAEDADSLIKQSVTYLDSQCVFFRSGAHYLQINEGISIPLSRADVYFSGLREQIVKKIIQHLLDEVGQDQYSNHGSRGTYNAGCRGLLCRRAQRDGLRPTHGSTRNAKYAVADALLEEAEARILPEEVVGHVRYTDRVASHA